jgi:hypothetical protein
LTTVPTNAHERDPLAKASQQLIDVLRAMADHAKREKGSEPSTSTLARDSVK